MTFRIATVVGARPQFIKAAAVSRAIRTDGHLEELLIHTGQHYDDSMSAVFFRELEIPEPAIDLGISAGPHGAMTGRMMAAIEQVLEDIKPAAVLVYGDTNSTLAGALAAAKLHIPVAHVEAGLRSFNRRMPEEINRVVTDHVSSIHFCPTVTAVQNLATEGIHAGVHHSGDVMYDATRHAAAAAASSPILDHLRLRESAFALCTLHRAENTDDAATLDALLRFVSDDARDLRVIMPLHPRTRAAIQRFAIMPPRIEMIEPLGYFDLHALLASADRVYTDSGGLQKEAYFHRTPCITLRSETEWVETVEHGWNRLWKDAPVVRPRSDIVDYGNGRSAESIVQELTRFLERRPSLANATV